MEVQNIPIGVVHPSPMNPRKTFEEDALQELSDNIRQQGLIQPITVRPRIFEGTEPGSSDSVAIPDGYEIVCGERRYRAMKALNAESPEQWPTIASIVRDMTDDEAFDAMITENLQRKDVDPIEEAYAFAVLLEKGNTADEVALRFGKSVRFVQDRVKLNNLIPELLLKVREGSMAIAAGMIICKFEEDLQRKFLATYGSYAKITKDMATRFTASEFMTLNRSAWYLSDNQDDEDFEGGCECKCRECPHNTSNANCLFWEMKATDDGKCTCRPKFEAKHRAYILHFIGEIAEDLVKKGDALEYGKTVLIDTASCWNAEAKRIHDEVIAEITDRGFEIVKPDEIFRNRVYYPASDDRIPEMLKNGECYRCIDIFGIGDLPSPKVAHYYIKPISKDTSATPGEVAPPEAVKLVGQYKRNLEICNEKIGKNHSDMAKEIGTTRRRGPLKDEEQIGFDTLILSQLPAEFFTKYYKICQSSGMRPTVQQIYDIAKGKTDDRDLWYREFLRVKMSESWYPGALTAHICADVMRLWKPDEVQEEDMKIIRATEKKNSKLKERLEELGYDVHGKKIEAEKKADQSEAVIHENTSDKSLMEQYEVMKKKHPDAILLFRVGDFYELFEHDAETAAIVLGITLTTRTTKGKTHQLCGFPAHSIDTYLPKLVESGNRVAICEQLQDPKNNK